MITRCTARLSSVRTRWLLGLLALGLLMLPAGDALAGGRGRRWDLWKNRANAVPRDTRLEYSRPTSLYDYYRELYPKYYGSMHARELERIGVPSGDIGLRGNGIFWTPW